MITRLKLLRNIGQFDSVDAGKDLPLRQLTLIYAANGRGKTTISAILDSLSTGNAVRMDERHRLGTPNSPHVVVEWDEGASVAVFENGGWNITFPNMVVFNDTFVDENVHSGLAVDSSHRQNLHEVILGSQGGALVKELDDLVDKIESHNHELKTKAEAIPNAVRAGLSVEAFCELPPVEDIDARIATVERRLAAARNQDSVSKAELFQSLTLPAVAIGTIDNTLARELADLDAAAEARVRFHIQNMQSGGEQWLSTGMRHIVASNDIELCPFCGQDLTASVLLAHYRAFFSQEYEQLKGEIAITLERLRKLRADGMTQFERDLRGAGETRQFWSQFCEVPDMSLDTLAIDETWNAMLDDLLNVIGKKQTSPLDQVSIPEDTRHTIEEYEKYKHDIECLNRGLSASNAGIAAVKQQATGASVDTIAEELKLLRATHARYTPNLVILCDAYTAELKAKKETETRRAKARTALDKYRGQVFPASEEAINDYLSRFNAGFRVGSLKPTMTRGGATCTYGVVINDISVPIGANSTEGEQTFGNTLSAGDRNTLALAMFFASLDAEPDISNKVVVVDDPISSLDDHRAVVTTQEMRRLASRCAQIIVLSHNKRFLCRIWDGVARSTSVALEVRREGAGSTLCEWDVNADSTTEHDRRYELLDRYNKTGSGDKRDVAQSIRPHLEAFLRVAFPGEFRPGVLIGAFVRSCRQNSSSVLRPDLVNELDRLLEYANTFHHDTNPAWESVQISDGELQSFVRRTLAFAQP